MTNNKLIYLESSVVSYLANRPSSNQLSAARQALTHDWWESVDKSKIWVSQLVLDEIAKGNPEAAHRRLAMVEGLQSVVVTAEALDLAARLISSGVVPANEPEDATHIALAALHKFAFLVTWNFSHFVGSEAKLQVMRALSE